MKSVSTLLAGICIFFSFPCAHAQDSRLNKFPKDADPKIIGERLVSKFLRTPHSRYGNTRPENPPSQVTYPDVCTWLGSLWFAEAVKNKGLYDSLEKRFEPLMGVDRRLQPRPNHVDNNVFGALPLELYRTNRNKQYLDLGLLYADSQWELPAGAGAQEKEWADKGYSWQTRIWIDDMFMITTVQSQAYLATGKRKYIDRAAAEMAMYLEKIQRPNGLFYHAPSAPFFWGRGNGWMAAGMAELLYILPKDNMHRNTIMNGYKKMMAALLMCQSADGMWNQLVDDPKSWKETSATAMFTYAFITGVRNGWLDKKIYGAAARKAWISLVKYINKEDELTDVCEGTNIKDDYQYYLNRKRITGDLHGQAPVIWCAYALVKKK